MPFAMTNKAFTPINSIFMPACHQELADQTLVSSALTTAVVNTGIVGLRAIRVRWLLKTLGGQAATESIRVTVQVGTGAALTNPTSIAQDNRTMVTGDTAMMGDFMGYSNAGFQSYQIVISSSGSARVPVLDLMVDCA